MGPLEVHYLCVIRSDYTRSTGSVLRISKDFNLNLGRIKTCRRGFLGSMLVETNDVLVEFVGLSGNENGGFITAAENISPGISVTIEPAETITVIETHLLYYIFCNTFILSIKQMLSNCRTVSDAASGSCTFCLLKPHVLQQKLVGEIVQHILSNGFRITSYLTVTLSRVMADELFGVYRGIIPKYNDNMQQICCGPSVALMIEKDSNVVEEFRELCGPIEPEVAAKLRPNSIRGRYGESNLRNAVHCTDLPEDGLMECGYVFGTLGNI